MTCQRFARLYDGVNIMKRSIKRKEKRDMVSKKQKQIIFKNLFKTELVQYQYTVRNNLFFFTTRISKLIVILK